MFCKRQKKYFPPGVFIPTLARSLAIIQLCLAFTILLWNGSLPFMGELFTIKSKRALFHYVMGIKNSENGERFKLLPEEVRLEISKKYQLLQKELNKSFYTKLNNSLKQVLVSIPPFELAWIFFAILLSLLLLLRVEGAVQAVWVLPLLAGAYALDNRIDGKTPPLSEEQLLFPSERGIINEYLKEPLSPNIIEQKKQLQQGWELYLIDRWVHEKPASDKEIYRSQVAQGEFNFHLERLKKMELLPRNKGPWRESMWLLGLYIFWNLSFALIMTKVLRKEMEIE